MLHGVILFNSHAWLVEQHWQGKSNTRMSHVKHQSEEDGGSNDNGEATMISLHNAYTQMQSSMAGPSSLRKNSELPTHHAAAEFSTSSVKKEPGMSVREPGVVIKEQQHFLHYVMSLLVCYTHALTTFYILFSPSN